MVIESAAATRSHSFSRWSSSTTTIMPPFDSTSTARLSAAVAARLSVASKPGDAVPVSETDERVESTGTHPYVGHQKLALYCRMTIPHFALSALSPPAPGDRCLRV